MKNVKSWLPGLVISIVFIAFILTFVDIRQLGYELQRANLFWLAMSAVAGFVWLSMRGVVWLTILRGKASYKAVFLSLNVGYLLNNFLPMRLGELGRAFFLSRKSNLAFMEILPTIIVERVIDLAFSAAIVLSVIPYVPSVPDTLKGAAYVASVLVVIGMFAMYLLARNHVWALGLYEKLGNRWLLLQRFSGLVKSLFEGLAILTDGWLFLRVMGLMTLNWAIAIVQYWVILLTFFPNAQPVWAMLGLGGAAFGGAIPALPGAVGTFEGGMGGALNLIANDAAKSFAAAVVAHLLNYLVTGIIGIYALSKEGKTLSSIYQDLMKLRQSGQKDQ